MGADAIRAGELHPPESPWRAMSYFYAGASRHLADDTGGARELLEEGARKGSATAPIAQVFCLVQLTFLHMERDDLEDALRVVAQAREQLERFQLGEYPILAFFFVASALTRAHEGRIEEAAADSNRARKMLEGLDGFPDWYQGEARIYLARACLLLDDSPAATELLAEAAEFADRLDDAPALSRWLSEAESAAAAMAGGEERSELTPAELRTLRFLPSHLSFREIADQSFVSANTVKTQAQAIYRKLDATSRGEAVEHARDRGLLQRCDPWLIPRPPARARRRARRRGAGRHGRRSAAGSRPPIGRSPSRSSRARTRPASRSSSRSATAAWAPRRSPSTAARRGSWPRTWPPARARTWSVQLCGDAHLSNFGVFAAPDRRLIFDINDFDETHPGPFEWDVKRLVASFAIGGRDLGFKETDRRAAVAEAAGSTGSEMRRLAAMRTIDVWYERLDLDDPRAVPIPGQAQGREGTTTRAVAKAESKNSLRAFAKLTHSVDGELRIVSDPPLITPVEDVFKGAKSKEIAKRLLELLAQYRKTLDGDVRHLVESYRYVHAARKVVGVGSVGTRAWIVLFLGRDSGDPLFLQVKEAEASVLEGFTGKSSSSSRAGAWSRASG